MSKIKQIEEMAWLKCCCHSNKGICGMDGKPCDLDCGSYHEAEALYNAGYRKDSEVTEEIFAEIESKLTLNKVTHCGQKLYYIRLKDDIAELKKKYTEEGK